MFSKVDLSSWLSMVSTVIISRDVTSRASTPLDAARLVPVLLVLLFIAILVRTA